MASAFFSLLGRGAMNLGARYLPTIGRGIVAGGTKLFNS